MKYKVEWKIRVPWGELALVSRGHPDGEPVFLVHGRQDSVSIFSPVLDLLPDDYYYVGLDMPGNGLSDAFPPEPRMLVRPSHLHHAETFETPPEAKAPFIQFCKHSPLVYKEPTDLLEGPKIMRFHFLAAMELAIEHLGWDEFIFIGHSMGCEQGLFYNAIHPNRITKMILFDAGTSLMRMQIEDPAEFQRTYFDKFYENYDREQKDRKVYTRISAMQAMRRMRDLTDPQCAGLLDRNFHELNVKRKWLPLMNWYPDQNSNDAQKSNAPQSSNEARNAEEPVQDEAAERRIRQYLRGHDIMGVQNPNTPTTGHPDLRRVMQYMRDHNTVGYLSWDNRLKSLAPQNYGNEYYFQLFKTIPPTLLLAAIDGAKNLPMKPEWRQGAEELLSRMAELKNFHRVDVEGGHDVHYTNPERVAPHIIKFLKENKVSSKL